MFKCKGRPWDVPRAVAPRAWASAAGLRGEGVHIGGEQRGSGSLTSEKIVGVFLLILNRICFRSLSSVPTGLVLLLPQTPEREKEKKFFFKKNIFFLLIVNSRKAIRKLYIYFSNVLLLTALINIMTSLVS